MKLFNNDKCLQMYAERASYLYVGKSRKKYLFIEKSLYDIIFILFNILKIIMIYNILLNMKNMFILDPYFIVNSGFLFCRYKIICIGGRGKWTI